MWHNVVEIHQDTAADFKVVEGDTVLVESPRACVECQVRVSEGIRPQVVQLYYCFEEANAILLKESGSYDPITRDWRL